MHYILKTTNGKLHRSTCAKGKTPNRRLSGGSQRHYSSIREAIKNIKYKSSHINKYCIKEKNN